MNNRAVELTALTYSVADRAMPGQTESGDGYVVAQCHDGTLVAVIDGLGHGPHAAAATRAAQATLEEYAVDNGGDLQALIQKCHERLRRTRGAAMTLAFFHAAPSAMTWLGVGNVKGVLFRPDTSEASSHVVLRGGVVGGNLPSLHSSTVALVDGDLLVFATDGVDSGFTAAVDPKGTPAQIAEDILETFARHTDDALVLVARWADTP